MKYRFLFDNDNVGLSKSKEKITQGKQVFNWKSYLNDNGLDANLKDINEVLIINQTLPNIEPYFI